MSAAASPSHIVTDHGVNERYLATIVRDEDGAFRMGQHSLRWRLDAQTRAVLNLCKRGQPLDEIEAALNQVRGVGHWFGKFPFADELDASFLKMYRSTSELMEDCRNPAQAEEAILRQLHIVLLEDAYWECDRSQYIVAYSHKRRGWSTYEYELDDEFKISVVSNFGYGRSSYFHLIVTYRGIDLCPYSEWILYRYRLWKEILSYTQRYELDDSGWIPCFEFVIDTYNKARNNESEFVNEFVVRECEALADGLAAMMNSGKLLFKDEDEEAWEYDEDDGFVIKADKIVGALEIVDNLARLMFVSVVPSYIDKIIGFNRALRPQISDYIVKMECDVRALEDTLVPRRAELQEARAAWAWAKEYYERAARTIEAENQEYGFVLRQPYEHPFMRPYHAAKEAHSTVTEAVRELERTLQRKRELHSKLVGYLTVLDAFMAARDTAPSIPDVPSAKVNT